MFDWDDLAERAYTAYGQTTNFKNFRGEAMPEFDALPETIRKAWKAAVIEAVTTYSQKTNADS